MNYSLLILPRALKEIADLPFQVQDRIDEAISSLASDPRPHGCRKLREGIGWRIRVAQYRIIYEIDDNSRTVVVVNVGHRREIYR